MKCDIGDRVELEAKATSTQSGEPVDPDDCYWKVVPVKGGEDDVEKVEVTRVEAGLFTGVFVPAIAGKHLVLFHGAGEDGAAEETSFTVKTPKVPRD